MLSQYASPGYLPALLEGGSQRRAYLLKERVKDLDQLVAAIHAVADGGSVFDPKVVEALVAENARSDDSLLNELTPRERDVLREMAEGKNNAAIADALVLTERSVEKVIHSIFLKLGLRWEAAVHKRVKAVDPLPGREQLGRPGGGGPSSTERHRTVDEGSRLDRDGRLPPRASTWVAQPVEVQGPRAVRGELERERSRRRLLDAGSSHTLSLGRLASADSQHR